jgi:hypothetical protein
MSETSQGPGWWQASDGKWYPPEQSSGAPPAPPKPPKPVRPAPDWVRPVYLYFLSFVGVLIAAFGVLTFVLGVAHFAVPDLDKGDPIFRISSAVIEVAEATIEAQESADSDDDFGSSSVPPEVSDALDSAKDEIRNQARDAALNDIVKGLVIIGLGVAIYLFHWRKAEATGA